MPLAMAAMLPTIDMRPVYDGFRGESLMGVMRNPGAIVVMTAAGLRTFRCQLRRFGCEAAGMGVTAWGVPPFSEVPVAAPGVAAERLDERAELDAAEPVQLDERAEPGVVAAEPPAALAELDAAAPVQLDELAVPGVAAPAWPGEPAELDAVVPGWLDEPVELGAGVRE